jgi:hypothetical protein
MSRKSKEEALTLPAIYENFPRELLAPLAIEEIDANTPQALVIAQDAKIINNALRCLVAALPFSYDVGDLCSLVRTTLSTLETRRKLLLLPIQAPQDRQKVYDEEDYLIPFNS